MRNREEQDIRQIEQTINQTRIATLQETLQSNQLYLMNFQIMDADANLLVDPQDLFEQHGRLEDELTLLIEKYQSLELEQKAKEEEAENLKVILQSLVSKGAQEDLLKTKAEGLDDPEVQELISHKLREIGFDAEALKRT